MTNKDVMLGVALVLIVILSIEYVEGQKCIETLHGLGVEDVSELQ